MQLNMKINAQCAVCEEELTVTGADCKYDLYISVSSCPKCERNRIRKQVTEWRDEAQRARNSYDRDSKYWRTYDARAVAYDRILYFLDGES